MNTHPGFRSQGATRSQDGNALRLGSDKHIFQQSVPMPPTEGVGLPPVLEFSAYLGGPTGDYSQSAVITNRGPSPASFVSAPRWDGIGGSHRVMEYAK